MAMRTHKMDRLTLSNEFNVTERKRGEVSDLEILLHVKNETGERRLTYGAESREVNCNIARCLKLNSSKIRA